MLPFVDTARLRLRPFLDGEAGRLAQLAGAPALARMMGSVPLPFSAEAAAEWMALRAWDNPPGFMLAICDPADLLLGGVGVGPAPQFDFGYFIGADYAGRGYATEAGQAVVAEVFAGRDAPVALSASCFQDNLPSRRVLEKLGFHYARSSVGRSKARLEPGPIWQYRLTRAAFEAQP
ncbi:MAG: GNAT family N-acetyltransferase [Pseudomonadota bacterium]